MIGSVNLSKSGFDADSIEVFYGVILNGGQINTTYPDGFNFSNCAPISFGVTADISRESYKYYLNNVNVYVEMGKDQITIHNNNSESLAYRLVLLKLPEPDISGYQLGDVTMNKKVNKSDINRIMEYDIHKNNEIFNSKQFKLADATGNGIINASDALAIAKLPYYEDTED